MMGIAGWLCSQCKVNWPHLNLILGTPSYFVFLGWHQCTSHLVTVLLGTIWSSIKQIEAPYVFDWENTIAVDTMQGNRASSRGENPLSSRDDMASMELFRVPLLKLVFLLFWDGYIRESLYFPKVRQATCLVGWGMGDCTRSNTAESGVISNWFGLHRTISHSFGEISVILELWSCSWGISGVPSSKSRLHSCCFVNMEFLSMQCRGIVPHLSLKVKSHEFSRVAAGTWGIFSSYVWLAFQYSCFFSNVSTPV